MEKPVFASRASGDEDFKTHKQVMAVANRLESQNITVWVDEEQIRYNVIDSIAAGIAASNKILVFLTKRYMERLMNPNNNCTRELEHCVRRKGLENLIILLFEDGLQDYKTWSAKADFLLGGQLYIDISSSEKLEENLSKVVEEIKK